MSQNTAIYRDADIRRPPTARLPRRCGDPCGAVHVSVSVSVSCVMCCVGDGAVAESHHRRLTPLDNGGVQRWGRWRCGAGRRRAH